MAESPGADRFVMNRIGKRRGIRPRLSRRRQAPRFNSLAMTVVQRMDGQLIQTSHILVDRDVRTRTDVGDECA